MWRTWVYYCTSPEKNSSSNSSRSSSTLPIKGIMFCCMLYVGWLLFAVFWVENKLLLEEEKFAVWFS